MTSRDILIMIRNHYDREESVAAGRALFMVKRGGRELVWLDAEQFAKWLGVGMTADELEKLAPTFPPPAPPVLLPPAPEPPPRSAPPAPRKAAPLPPHAAARFSFRRLLHIFH